VTARSPEGWDPENFGPGIINARSLLELALDDIPSAALESAGRPDQIAKLLIEEIGPGLRDATFPSIRFELEIATIALAQASLGIPVAGLSEAGKTPGTRPSPQLAAAVAASSDIRLKHFGIDANKAIVRPTLPSPQIAYSLGPLSILDQRRINRIADILTETPGDGASNEQLLMTVEQTIRLDRQGVVPNRGQRMVAEVLVRLTDRPALRVRGGRIAMDGAAAGAWRDRLILLAATDHIETNLTRIGRIDASGAHVGTGFIVGSGLVLTNRHVLQLIAAPVPRRRSPERWILTEDATIDFADEPSSQTTASRFKITDIVSAGPDPIEYDSVDLRNLDAALIAVELTNDAQQKLPAPMELDPRLTSADRTRVILVSGYPAPPPALPLNAQGEIDDQVVRRLAELYKADYGTKYVAPGEVVQAAGKHPLDPRHWVFTHDATTLVGNSGSAVLATTGNQDVIGLHFGGQWMRENYAHSLSALRATTDLAGFSELNWALQ